MQSEMKDSSTQTYIHPNSMLSYKYWAACFEKSQLSPECDELGHFNHSPVCTEEDCLGPYSQQSFDATSDDGVELPLISKTICSNSSCRLCNNGDVLHFDFIKDLDCRGKCIVNFRSSSQDNAQCQGHDVVPTSSLRRIKSRLKKSFSHDVSDCSSFPYVADSSFDNDDKDSVDECECLLCESRREKSYASSFSRNQEKSFNHMPSDYFVSLRNLNESAEDLVLGERSSSNTRHQCDDRNDHNDEPSDIDSAPDALLRDISEDTIPPHDSQFAVTSSVGKCLLSASCKLRRIPQHQALNRRNSEPNHLNAQRNRHGDTAESCDSSEEKVIRSDNRCSRILYELEELKSGNTKLLSHDGISEPQTAKSLDNLDSDENIKGTFTNRTIASEEGKSLGVDATAVRTLSHHLLSHSIGNVSFEQIRLQNKMTIELFALENFNEHRFGFLGKTVSFTSMLSWTKDCIGKPMIRTQNRAVKRTAPEIFRLVQMYMGDRKSKLQQMQIALLIIQKNMMIEDLRDETYAQLCRQTTNNPQEGSLMHGWVLMGICLSAFFPSFRFQACLTGYICQHMSISENNGFICHFATYCRRLLERASKRNVKGTLPKINVEYVERSLKSIFRPSHFGSSLEDLMQVQKYRYPDRTLPWIQTSLSEKMLCLNCPQVEGIFRVPGDKDEVSALQTTCDQWILPESCSDPHVLASLLKQWYRDLYEPLIPSEFYDECIGCTEGEAAVAIVQRMPTANQLVLSYLIRFLQVFAAVENSSISKMDASNLATVMAPNCLHCESDDVEVILKNAPKESNFIKTLILCLDTSFVDGIC